MAAHAADLATAAQTWQDGLASLSAALDQALAEIGERLDAHIAAGEAGADPFETELIAAETRLAGLRRELDAARGDLEHAYTNALEAASGEAARAMRWQRFEQRKSGLALSKRMVEEGQACLVRRQAAAARALFERASEEWNEPRDCRACGAQIVVGGVWEPTNFTCDACGVVTTVHPARQTQAFYANGHLNSICAEAAFDQWVALQNALATFRKLRHPTPADFQPVEAAAATWASAVNTLRGELDPTWTGTEVAAQTAADARDALAELGDDDAQSRRVTMEDGARIAQSGDLGEVLTWARTLEDDPAGPVAQLAVCVHEHEDRGVAWQVLALQHHVQRITDDRDTWMRDKLAELDEDLRTR